MLLFVTQTRPRKNYTSEVSVMKKANTICYIQNQKNDTNESIYETDPQTEKIAYGYQRGRDKEG